MVPEILNPRGICVVSVNHLLNCSDRYTQHSTESLCCPLRGFLATICAKSEDGLSLQGQLLFLAVHTCSTSQLRMLSQSESSACLRSTWTSCSLPTPTQTIMIISCNVGSSSSSFHLVETCSCLTCRGLRPRPARQWLLGYLKGRNRALPDQHKGHILQGHPVRSQVQSSCLLCPTFIFPFFFSCTACFPFNLADFIQIKWLRMPCRELYLC